MIKEVILRFSFFLTLINKIVPKKSNRIVFYSNLGFRDNSKSLFDYLIRNNYQEKYEIIVSTNDYKLFNDFHNVRFINCWLGVYYFFTSKYFFYSFGKYPIMPARNQTVINLWHGMPLKKIGNLEAGKENKKYDFFSFILSTGPVFNRIMEESFKCDSDRILNIGQPRNDVFFSDSDYSHFKGYDKIIIWMPTFRKSSILNESNTSCDDYILPIIKNNEELNELNLLLKKHNILVLIKLHPIQNTQGYDLKDLSNILFIDESFLGREKIELYKLLSMTDGLITDYSSVYIDYLLLNKPIIFTIDDFIDYNENRGLNFDSPFEVMPGAKVENVKELLEEIKNIANGLDLYEEKRERVNSQFNLYDKRGNNCSSILEFCNIRR